MVRFVEWIWKVWSESLITPTPSNNIHQPHSTLTKFSKLYPPNNLSPNHLLFNPIPPTITQPPSPPPQMWEQLQMTDEEMAEVTMKGVLFEVVVPEFKQMRQCHKELSMLRNLWDYTALIRNEIEMWKKTPWKEINIELMDLDCKKLSKDLKGLDKETKYWDVYVGTVNLVKNLMTSLKSVSELQNPAIRNRHWVELMNTTGVSGGVVLWSVALWSVAFKSVALWSVALWNVALC